MIASFRASPNWDVQLDLKLLQALWPKLVGAQLAEATRVQAIDGTRVIVSVPDATWKTQLIPERYRLLRSMNEPWPNPWITEIWFTDEDR